MLDYQRGAKSDKSPPLYSTAQIAATCLDRTEAWERTLPACPFGLRPPASTLEAGNVRSQAGSTSQSFG
jgi:hypothetical protein